MNKNESSFINTAAKLLEKARQQSLSNLDDSNNKSLAKGQSTLIYHKSGGSPATLAQSTNNQVQENLQKST